MTALSATSLKQTTMPTVAGQTKATLRNGKLICVRVQMLDDTVSVFHLSPCAVGAALYEEVFRHLNLIEAEYFGLQFIDADGCECLLEKSKRIVKQLTACKSEARLFLVVKFYPPTPADLEEEYTRYLFALQIKRDLSSGSLICNENTAAILASYIVQSECGDFSSEDYVDYTYLSSANFVPNQTAEFEKKVMENHKKLVGMMPSESDIALLETVRRCEFYGCRFHQAKDVDGNVINLTVLHLGIKVYQTLCCVSTFSWAKVRKLCFKRKNFIIKLHSEIYSLDKDTVTFLFETRHECKLFWKSCIEYHSFFRCAEVNRIPKSQSGWFAKGCSYRYDGRTQKQLTDYLREHVKRREPFCRPVYSSISRNDLRRYTMPLLPYDNGTLENSQSAFDLTYSDSSYVGYYKGNRRKGGNAAKADRIYHTLPKSVEREQHTPNSIEQGGEFQFSPRREEFVHDTTERLNDTCIAEDKHASCSSYENENLSQASYRLSQVELTKGGSEPALASTLPVGVGDGQLSGRVDSTQPFKGHVTFTDTHHNVKYSFTSFSKNVDLNKATRKPPVPPPKPKLGLTNLKLLPNPMSTSVVEDGKYAVIKHKVFDGDIPYTLHVRQLRQPERPTVISIESANLSTFKSANECTSSIGGALAKGDEAPPACGEAQEPPPSITGCVKTLSTEV